MAMKKETEDRLLSINRAFYKQFADSFALSRRNPQPGYTRLLGQLPVVVGQVLDVGCGNARFGRFLQDHLTNFQYTGIDFSPELLAKAREEFPGTYFPRDISRAGFLDCVGKFDVIACLSTMQHIPGKSNRIRLLGEIRRHLTHGGIIIMANWQFLSSARQKRKIQEWDLVDIDAADVEANDYLLTWQRDGYGLRYVCMIDAQETDRLAKDAGLMIKQQFRSDGKEGDLNLYTVMAEPFEKAPAPTAG